MDRDHDLVIVLGGMPAALGESTTVLVAINGRGRLKCAGSSGFLQPPPISESDDDPLRLRSSDMTLKVRVDAPSVPKETADEFRALALLIFSAYRQQRERLRIPAARVTAVLADEFEQEVRRWLPFGDFEAERIGGQAVGKNLCQDSECRDIVIVFDAALWREPGDEVDRLFRAAIIGHELAHPIQSRAAYASGAMDGVELPSITPHEAFRSAGRILANEYRADRLAELVVGQMATADLGDGPRPYATWNFRNTSYMDALIAQLSAAYPAWPDLVDRYRDWEIPLEAMFVGLATQIDQTLTLLFHAQAFADAAGADQLLLDSPQLAALPASRLYLAPALAPFMAVVRQTPILTSLVATRAAEAEFTRQGLAAHLEIFSRLGITPRDLPRPSVYIDVTSPMR